MIPVDKKWFTRTVVTDVIVEKLKSPNLGYPTVNEEQVRYLFETKEVLKMRRPKEGFVNYKKIIVPLYNRTERLG